MPIPVKCQCGQQFKAKDKLAGKAVKCPKCGNPLKIGMPAAATPTAQTAKSTMQSAKIPVTCQCGKTFQAPPKLAGKRVKCPACGQGIQIPTPNAQPTPQPVALADPLGDHPLGAPLSDPLSDALSDPLANRADPLATQDPSTGFGGASPLGTEPVAGAAPGLANAWAQQAGGQANANLNPAAAKPSPGGSRRGIIIGAIVGGGVLALLLVGGVLAVVLSGMFADSDTPVATNTDPDTTAQVPPESAAGQDPAPTQSSNSQGASGTASQRQDLPAPLMLVNENTVLVARIDVAEIMKAKPFAGLPKEILEEALNEQFPVNILECDAIWVFVQNDGSVPSLRFTFPSSDVRLSVASERLGEASAKSLTETNFAMLNDDTWFHFVGESSLQIGTREAHQLSKKGQFTTDSKLIDRMMEFQGRGQVAVVANIAPHRDRILDLLKSKAIPGVSPVLPNWLNQASLAVDFNNANLVDLQIEPTTAAAGKNLMGTLQAYLTAADRGLQAASAALNGEDAGMTGPGLKILQDLLKNAQTTTTDNQVRLSMAKPPSLDNFSEAVMASAPAPSTSDQRSRENLRGILIAIHNHNDTFKVLPAAYNTDEQDKPLLSWRVRILPYIERQALYDQFHHNEPWDSEHNIKLLEQMPPIFRAPNSKAEPNMTTYHAIGGPNGSFGPPREGAEFYDKVGKFAGHTFGDISDGLSQTVFIVEASDETAVEWTKPVEFVPDPEDPTKGMLGMYADGFYVAAGSSVVLFLPSNCDKEILTQLFHRNDGQVVRDLNFAKPPKR